MVTDSIRQVKDTALRTERLASATYLVSGYLPDAEPLKWSLRGRVIELATLVASVNSEFIPAKVSQLINEIIMLLNLALLNPGVSEMNFSLLRQEYLGLQQFLEGRKINLLPPVSDTPLSKPKTLQPTTYNPKPQSYNRPTTPRRDLILQYVRSSGGGSSIKDIAQAI